MKAWDYAKTFFRSEKLHISYPKADTGTKINIFWIFLHIMHVHAPCTYAVYVFYASILCMYSMHVFYTGHLVDPQGPFGRMFRKLRIQGRMQIFEKMFQKALNRVLTPDCSGGGDLLQYPLKNMDLQNKNISVMKL